MARDIPAQAVREMERSFHREILGTLVCVNIQRPATDSVFDPVEETYSGGTDAININLKALNRKERTYLIDNQVKKMCDRKITILQSELPFEPRVNDIIDGNYRVLDYYEDPTHCFWTLMLKGLDYDR